MIIALGYTKHAFERMTERDISRASVEAVVRHGDVERIDRHGVVRYRLEGMVVVLDGSDVVTVYNDSDLRAKSDWSPKKKQRCRSKETKPTYIRGRGHINIKRQDMLLRQMEGRR